MSRQNNCHVGEVHVATSNKFGDKEKTASVRILIDAFGFWKTVGVQVQVPVALIRRWPRPGRHP